MTPAEQHRSARLALAFSSVGHTFNHLFEPIFFVVAGLTLPDALGISFAEVVALALGGKILLGAAAPLAGWLGDRWGAANMMGVYFIGQGSAAVLVGFAETPWQIAGALAVLGLFASIYHPVGIAWLVRNAENRGTALGINGIFGSLGPAIAGTLAAVLTEAFGWRSAFVIPGLAMLAVGIAFCAVVGRGTIVDTGVDRKPDPAPDRRDTVRVYSVFALTMLCSGFIYQATQAALPKFLHQRAGADLGEGLLGVGAAVSVIYLCGALAQFVGGRLADRWPLKWVYLAFWLLQAVGLSLATTAAGLPVVVAAMVMVFANSGSLPPENALFARYTPARWRATAFGVKFVLAFGVSTIALPAVGWIHAATGAFTWLFGAMVAMAAVSILAGLGLPGRHRLAFAAQPAAAE